MLKLTQQAWGTWVDPFDPSCLYALFYNKGQATRVLRLQSDGGVEDVTTAWLPNGPLGLPNNAEPTFDVVGAQVLRLHNFIFARTVNEDGDRVYGFGEPDLEWKLVEELPRELVCLKGGGLAVRDLDV